MKKGNKRLIISLVVVALLYAGGCLIEQTAGTKSMVVTVLQKGAVYALIAVSMNLLNGFTGLFSLGQAGFMLVVCTLCICKFRIPTHTFLANSRLARMAPYSTPTTAPARLYAYLASQIYPVKI